MKKIFIITFILLVCIVAFYQIDPDIYINRSLSYNNCTIKYPHYLTGRVKLSEGHYVTNENTIFYAHRKLALCLCEEYMKTKSEIVKEKIFELNNKYSSGEKEIDIDSIIKKRLEIFDPIMYIE